jgi:hypothetical protein
MQRVGLVVVALGLWMGGAAGRCLAQAPFLVQVGSTGAFRPGEWPVDVPAVCVRHVAAGASRCLSKSGDKWVVAQVANPSGPFSVELPMNALQEPVWVDFGAVTSPIDEQEALKLAAKAVVAAGGLVPAPATPPLPVWEWLERTANFNRMPASVVGEQLVIIFNCVGVVQPNSNPQTLQNEVFNGQTIPMRRWSPIVSVRTQGLVSPAPGPISPEAPLFEAPPESLRCAASKEVDFARAVSEFVTSGDRWLRSVVLDAMNDNLLRGALVELVKADPATREALLRIAATNEAARTQTKETLLFLLQNDAAFKAEVRQLLGSN